jgi:hypothetical protein
MGKAPEVHYHRVNSGSQGWFQNSILYEEFHIYQPKLTVHLKENIGTIKSRGKI